MDNKGKAGEDVRRFERALDAVMSKCWLTRAEREGYSEVIRKAHDIKAFAAARMRGALSPGERRLAEELAESSADAMAGAAILAATGRLVITGGGGGSLRLVCADIDIGDELTELIEC